MRLYWSSYNIFSANSQIIYISTPAASSISHNLLRSFYFCLFSLSLIIIIIFVSLVRFPPLFSITLDHLIILSLAAINFILLVRIIRRNWRRFFRFFLRCRVRLDRVFFVRVLIFVSFYNFDYIYIIVIIISWLVLT